MVKLLKVLILPLAIFLISIKKILKVNFHVIAIDKIGHLNAETFIYHNFRDQNSFITKNFFLVRKKPSNIFNFKMWKRTVKFRKDNFFFHTLRSLIFYFDKKYNINSKNLSFIIYEKKNLVFGTGLLGDHNEVAIVDEDEIGLLTGKVRGKMVYNAGVNYYNSEDIVWFLTTA